MVLQPLAKISLRDFLLTLNTSISIAISTKFKDSMLAITSSTCATITIITIVVITGTHKEWAH